MRINPVFARYLKHALIFVFFSFIIISSNIFSREKTLDGFLEEAKTFAALMDEGKSYEEIMNDNRFEHLHYWTNVESREGESIPDVKNQFGALNGDAVSTATPVVFICILIFGMYIYSDDRNRNKSGFIYSLPVKREMLYFYKVLSAVVMITLTYAMTMLVYYIVFSRHIYDAQNLYMRFMIGETVDISIFDTFVFNYLMIGFRQYLMCMFAFAGFNIYLNLFGKSGLAAVLMWLTFMGLVGFLVGLGNFIYFYDLDISLSEETVRVINSAAFYVRQLIGKMSYSYNYLYGDEFGGEVFADSIIILIILVLFFIGLALFKYTKIERSGKTFLFNWVRYPLYAGIFVCGAFVFFEIADVLGMIKSYDINIGYALLILGGALFTAVFKNILERRGA